MIEFTSLENYEKSLLNGLGLTFLEYENYLQLKQKSMKKKYVVEHAPTGANIIVEIDHSFENLDRNIKDMVDFWSNSKEKLSNEKGDYTRTWLKMLLTEILNNECGESRSKQLEYFQDCEGFYPLDGSYGITLIDVSYPIFDEDDFDITII